MKKILLIEDDSFVANLYRSGLQAQNYEVDVAPDGQAGYYAVYEKKPDAILLDLSLPQMDGLSLLGKLRAQKKFRKLPVLVLADSPISELADQALAAGANQGFNKADPQALEQILAALGNLFSSFLGRNGPSPAGPRVAGSDTRFISRPTAPAEPVAPISLHGSTGRTSGAETRFLTRTPEPQAARPVEPGFPAAEGFGQPGPGGAQRANGEAVLYDEPAEVSPQAAAQASEEALMAQELKEAFLSEYGQTVHAIRKAFVQIRTGKNEEEKAAACQEFVRKIVTLRNDSAQCGIDGLVRLSTPFEALARQIAAAPAKATAPALQALANTVDLLAAMNNQLSEIDYIREINPTALVVDDESVSRRTATLALRKAAIDVTAVEDAKAALEIVESRPFDLIFLDVEMPGINGFALCARIRALPAHKRTPVVFITALDDLRTRASSKISGGNQFITKPVNFNELCLTALTFVLKEKMRL